MKSFVKALVLVVPFAAIGAVAAPEAHAGEYAPPGAAYVATYRPVYYNGYAHYWYNNHWYYRDGAGAWRWYDHEPAYLANERLNWERYHHVWR